MADRVGSVEIVIKGGRPWGFTLQGGAENKSALTVAQVERPGLALRPGDHVLKVNDVPCVSLADACQLVDAAFRTLTLLVWRSSAEATAPHLNAKDCSFIPAIRRRQKPVQGNTSREPDGNGQCCPGVDCSLSETIRYIPDIIKRSEPEFINNGNAGSYSPLRLPNNLQYDIECTAGIDGASEDKEQNTNMVNHRFDKKPSVYKALECKIGLDFSPVLNRRPGSDRREFFESMTLDSGCHDDVEQGTTTAKIYPAAEPQAIDSNITPPSIPCRNSSLQYCHGNAHEKYPSWPEISVRFSDASKTEANQRSSSWEEHMGKPKEHVYTRPQNTYHISPHHLQPVQEKTAKLTPNKQRQHEPNRLTEAEQLSADAIARFFQGSYFEIQYPNDNREYKTHSPPERDPPAPPSTLSRASSDEDVYNKNYENMLRYYSRSPALYGKWIKENYLNPETDTPLLDRLRMEKDNVASWPLFEESVLPRDAFTRNEDAPSYRRLHGSLEEGFDSTCSSQETLKMRSSVSDMEEPYVLRYYREREIGEVYNSSHSSKCNSRLDISASSEMDTESMDESRKSSRWDIGNLLCHSRSNSCWSLADAKKRSLKDRNQNLIIEDNSLGNNVRSFSTSFPGFAIGACARSSTNTSSPSEATSPITCKSHSTDTLDSDTSHGLVSKQNHDLSCERSRRAHGPTETELKSIQKQAVLSFYHRQRVNILQETSSPPLSAVCNSNPQCLGSLIITDVNNIGSEDLKDGSSDHTTPSRTRVEEALYVNLEELKLQNQLVNSSTQTTVSRLPQQETPIDDTTTRNILDHSSLSNNVEKQSSSCIKVKDERNDATLPLTSAYFTTSEPKAKLLTRYFDNKICLKESELRGKKEELASSISRKLSILRAEQVAVAEERRANEALGERVAEQVNQVAKASEIAKYRLHVEDLEKILQLLLSLSGRLARAQNALLILHKDAKVEEKAMLEAKQAKLREQHEEASHLKADIDRRSDQVALFLQSYFTADEYADYDHFIKMKSKLLMDSREIDDKIKLGEEQLSALRSSIDMEATPCFNYL